MIAGRPRRRVTAGRPRLAGLLVATVLVACDSAPVEIPRWVPPAAGPMPAAVAERMPLPFCGVATNERDPVLRCIVDAHRRRQPAEVGIVTGAQSGSQIGMLRLLPDMTIELLFFNEDRWRRGTCRSLVEDQPPAILTVDDCSDPVDLPMPTLG